MKTKTIEFLDEQAAGIEAGKEATKFAKARSCIKWLKEENLPLYWDILYNGLKDGDVLDMYAMRWANENHLNWGNVEVRNELRAKFGYLSDPYHRYTFPQQWVTRFADGSFDVNKEAINEYYRKKHTYTLTSEQVDAIEAVRKGMDTLGIHPRMFTNYFAKDTETGKTITVGYRVHAMLNGQPSIVAILNADK